jgi:hypothetical protein
MKLIKIIFNCICLLVVLNFSANAQSLWEIDSPSGWHYHVLDSDTSISSLQQIILDDSDILLYEAAIFLLVNKKESTINDFLLANLDTKIINALIPDSLIFENDSILARLDSTILYEKQWQNYFIDNLVLGYLGVQTAIEKLDSVARFSPDHHNRFLAMRTLGEAGFLKEDFFIEIMNKFRNENSYSLAQSCLRWYGKDNRFRSEIVNVLIYKIQEATDRVRISQLCLTLAEIDSVLGKNILISRLNERFYNSEGLDRSVIYDDLELIDPDNQPKRVMYAVPTETNDTLRFGYLPYLDEITKGEVSSKFCDPQYINFVKHWLQEESFDYSRNLLIDYYENAKPIIKDLNIAVLEMLDTLTSYTNQCYSYDWLKDETYKNELINKITTAKNYLTANDSLACRNEVSLFQSSVNQVYQDSVGSYPKYVSDAGYKFLYYYAQYILDRLPEPEAGLPVKLKDSQGNLLQGGSLQYYEGSRKDAVNSNDGTFNVITARTAVK